MQLAWPIFCGALEEHVGAFDRDALSHILSAPGVDLPKRLLLWTRDQSRVELITFAEDHPGGGDPDEDSVHGAISVIFQKVLAHLQKGEHCVPVPVWRPCSCPPMHGLPYNMTTQFTRLSSPPCRQVRLECNGGHGVRCPRRCERACGARHPM